MKKLLLTGAALCAGLTLAPLAPLAAQSLNDQFVLSVEPSFVQRVRTAVIATAVAVAGDGQTTAGTTTAFDGAGLNVRRHTQAQSILNSPDTWKYLFATAMATQAAVYNPATATGTVALTAMGCSGNYTAPYPACTGGAVTGNVVTQQALVSDAVLNTTASAVFNSFFGGQ